MVLQCEGGEYGENCAAQRRGSCQGPATLDSRDMAYMSPRKTEWWGKRVR
jgi:hypothetical protein